MSWIDAFQEADRDGFPRQLIRWGDPNPTAPSAAELGLPEEMNGEGPLVSVIIPTYDDDRYLTEALETIGRQTYANLELILVDSSEVSWLKRLADDRSWIRHIYQEPRGLSAARNEGIEAASGEYIALLDADDYWHPEKLRKQVSLLKSGKNAVYSDSYEVDLRGDEAAVRYRGGTPSASDVAHIECLHRDITPHISTIIYKKSVLPPRPFYEPLQNHEDVTFMVELFKRCPPGNVAEGLSVRRVRGGSMTDGVTEETYRNQLKSISYLSKKYPDLQGHLSVRTAISKRSLGIHYLRENNKSKARRYFIQSANETEHLTESTKSRLMYILSFVPVGGSAYVRFIQMKK